MPKLYKQLILFRLAFTSLKHVYCFGWVTTWVQQYHRVRYGKISSWILEKVHGVGIRTICIHQTSQLLWAALPAGCDKSLYYCTCLSILALVHVTNLCLNNCSYPTWSHSEVVWNITFLKHTPRYNAPVANASNIQNHDMKFSSVKVTYFWLDKALHQLIAFLPADWNKKSNICLMSPGNIQ